MKRLLLPLITLVLFVAVVYGATVTGPWAIWPSTSDTPCPKGKRGKNCYGNDLTPVVYSGYGGVYFDFPVAPTSVRKVGYLLAPYHVRMSGTLSATIQILTSGTPVFNYVFEPSNTCVTPAKVRFYIERVRWDRVGYPPGENYRWWSNPVALQLASTSVPVTLTVPLTPDQWSNVWGQFGNLNSTTRAGFAATLSDLNRVGLSFGGGCFFGHGVNVSNGTARFILTNYKTIP